MLETVRTYAVRRKGGLSSAEFVDKGEGDNFSRFCSDILFVDGS